MANIKELSEKIPERLSPGHRLCAGCGASIAVRQVLMGTEDPVVVVSATGCLEVATTIYPYTAWNVPFMHNAFENAASTISGIETAYRALKKKGKIKKEIKFIAFGGDGGTYDIGLQALSGALERGHNFVYVCYDNEAYMNTGIQRSSATPYGASTTTAPAGKAVPGKVQFRKDLTAIVAAHRIPYAAQATISNWNDLVTKSQKAFSAEGPATSARVKGEVSQDETACEVRDECPGGSRRNDRAGCGLPGSVRAPPAGPGERFPKAVCWSPV